jgi:sugar lactone lactonase YvrE
MKNRAGLLLAVAMTGFVLISGEGSAQSVYTPYTFSTLAGMAGSSGSTNGTGSVARFVSPVSVTVDAATNVYVADNGNNTIRKVTSAAVVTTLAGLPGSFGSANGTGSTARFNLPSGVAVDSAGNVYVADTGNSTIRKVTSAGKVTTLAGAAGKTGSKNGTGSAARFLYPSGVAVDSAGNIYVADTGNNTIRKVTPTGAVTTLAGLAGSAGYVNTNGSAARFSAPFGVAVDHAGNVYVADTRNNAIRKVTAAGAVTTLAGGTFGSKDGTGTAAQFNAPSSVAVDAATNVYVADYGNNTIRKVTPAGVVTTLAGISAVSGTNNGTGSGALFDLPSGVAVTAGGNVYVADTGNSTIRIGFPAINPPVIVPGSPAFSAGQFGFNLTGPAGQQVVVEASTNLSNWLAIWTNTFGASVLPFSDSQSSAESNRFYRAKIP